MYTLLQAPVLASPSPVPTGAWKVSLHENDGVELEFRMTFSAPGADPTQWEAYSKEGAARELIGGGTAALGRMLGKLPPRGALIAIVDGSSQASPEGWRMEGTLRSPFLGERRFSGLLANGRLHGELRRPVSGTQAGTIDAVPDVSTTPLRDYPALAADLELAIRQTLFDPSLLERPAFVRFFSELGRRFARARDDLDAVASFQALAPSLSLSHLAFIRNPRLAAQSLEETVAEQSASSEDPTRLSFPAPGIAFLRVTKWAGCAPAIDRAFQRIDADGSRVLLLDVRGNPGGDATSMTALGHLIREPLTVGTFLGSLWLRQHPGPLSQDDRASLPTLDTEASPLELITQLRTKGAVLGKALPRAPFFSGSVFVLVDAATASASEPLVHALKESHRATVLGERTAGAMLLALPHTLRDGWIAVIPEADFIAADGSRLEGRGVAPDTKCPSDRVFLEAADRIAPLLPYSSAVLRGATLEALKRPDDALRAYRAALQAASRQTSPVPTPAARAAALKRIAALLAARGDERGARDAMAEVQKLVSDDPTERPAAGD